MEEKKKDLEELNRHIEYLCKSKAEEFAILGYDNITGKDIWECVSASYQDELPPLHQLVNDILSLKVNTYMNWMTMKVYRNEEI
ncbi:MAG: hypothetical protein H0Z33_12115 [Bacillaceae bacterium]|nr:hypothetical protein [Bacillaceae bacterium]